MNHPDWVVRLFETIDRKDAEGFADFFTDDGSFVFANAEPVRGREAVREAVAGFFQSVEALSHELAETWVHSEAVVTSGQVTYTRLDGSRLTVPFADIFRLEGDRVREYHIYMDASQLYQTA